MALTQSPVVAPPQPQDKELTDYSSILQRLFSQLFQVAHVHVGKNGVMKAFPTSKDGAIGDILLAVVSGTAYVCFKTDDTHWFKIAGTGV